MATLILYRTHNHRTERSKLMKNSVLLVNNLDDFDLNDLFQDIPYDESQAIRALDAIETDLESILQRGGY